MTLSERQLPAFYHGFVGWFKLLCEDLNREIVMKRFADKIRRFVVSEDGPTAVEYAVMLALIIVVCLAAITTVGESANDTFQNVANQLSTTSGGSGQ